ncbi:M14 family metallopeptidase [Rummeliibacillus sp. TYF-LIM-RU47]|uniref:M14 family metallopeptidase n=1 Tax=unclassified Rummeliibacillus TaxID=2622809 RepID=UPI00123BE909|nr:M14 family metallopeptidase [Rummeliibacillus sp. TYF-LIM-RU47]
MYIYPRFGHSLWYYSQLFDVPLALIIDSNPRLEINDLGDNERLQIPGFTLNHYIAKQEETLKQIARKFTIPCEAILCVNLDLHENTSLTVGQKIALPQKVTWRTIRDKDHYDSAKMRKDLQALFQIYPFLKQQTIGYSVLNDPLKEIQIGKGPKKVHFNASFHGNEWITTVFLLSFLDDYLLALMNKTDLRETNPLTLYMQTTLSIVPMVNPDGVNLVLNGPPDDQEWAGYLLTINNESTDFTGWKANINGVDLNDQFPANWEIEKSRAPQLPGPRDYGGELPLTEPESIAMAVLTKQRDFDRVLAFHTQGEEIYWGYHHCEPKESKTIVKELCKVSGYKAVRNVNSDAGYKDWYIQEWRRPGFTVELGYGTNPLPIEQFSYIYKRAMGICLAALYM